MTRKADGRFSYPIVIDPPRKGVCIQVPLDENHARAFFAALNELALPFAWEWTGQASGNAPSAVWKDIIYDAAVQYYSGDDCMGCVTCLVSTAETIQYITDNQTIINDSHDDYVSSGGTSISTQVTNNVKYGVGHDDATDAQICFMAQMYIKAVAEGILQADLSKNKSETEQTQDVINLATIAFAGIALAVPALSVAVGLSVVVMSAAGVAIGLYATGTIDDDIKAALQDDEAIRETACCLFKQLAAATTIATFDRWRKSWNNNANCSTVGMSANGVILRQLWNATIAQDENSYLQFFHFMDDNNWLADADAIPQCPCTDCGDLTVYNDEDDVHNYTDFTVLGGGVWSDELLSGVYFGRTISNKVEYDFGELVCLDEITLFMRNGSQKWRIFMQTDNPAYPIIQWDSAQTAGSFLDNPVPLEGSVVCRKLTFWTRVRDSGDEDIYQNPALGPSANTDFDLVRASVLRFYTAT